MNVIRAIEYMSFFRSIYHCYKDWELLRRYRGWEARGKPIPPPHFVKRLAVKNTATQYSTPVLIETGTYKGDMVKAMADSFSRIYSIEVDAKLHQAASDLFRQQPHIRIVLGDSAVQLPMILGELKQAALFWLDGHYTGAHAGKADINTPIAKELALIAAHPNSSAHVILIDDARLFTGRDDYPSLDSLKEVAVRLFPKHRFEVTDDIIRLYPLTPANG